ncbi:hypothetical protein [Mannheimia bovis]|uniref:Uncharacterized protein n=1 Tax=Mannheimia bovis TaxID=2770636 RepID=A0A7H1C5J6_9PAST|nr:hypothetical protein [Mannheimia bovis]QNS16251.1 hypothetical protein ICJ55_05705 [Mannheimia bovis]
MGNQSINVRVDKPIAIDGLRGRGRAYKKWISGEVVQFCLRWNVKN